MDAKSAGISGTAIAVAATGAFLVYAGIKDIDFVSGLRSISSGQTPVGKPQTSTTVFGPGATAASGVAGVIAGSPDGGKFVAAARKKLGAKYVFGSVGPNTYDCSGLLIACLREIGYNGGKVPRWTTRTFAAWARSQGWIKVGEKDIQSGDVVLKSGHMGLAISNTEMIHAPHAGTVVKIGKIYSPRYMWSGWRIPATRLNATEGRIPR